MRVAGLDYSVGLPAAWLSSVEPVQFQKASLQEKSSEESLRVLRLSGNKETSVYQWNPVVEIAASPDASAPPVYMAQVRVRAAVSPSNSVSLVLSWLDEEQRRIAVKTLRLPEGEWTNGVTLRVAAHAPPGARWVGIGVRVQHQQRDDWAEFSDLHLWRF